MPLYEYQCSKCHRRIERIQSFSAEPLRVCEACGGPLERLISAPAIQFKGSGWYVTDYAKGSSAAAAAAKSDAAGKSDASSSEGKDSKPAADAKPAPAPAAPPAKD